MGPFAWGLLLGWVTALLLSSVVAYVAYGRYERLQRRARQAERLAELGTLTGGLAHEIKNPLSTVQLNLQLLREDLDPHHPGHGRLVSRLNTVQKEVSRLRDILDDFMRYAGKLELDRKRTDLGNLLEELVDFYSPQAQAHRVQLRLRKPDRPLVAPVDERLLKQALLNLMINAIQAMPESGGEVLLSATRQDGRAVVEVTDTGRGMAPETLSRIFQAYYSTKPGGTGLGLAIAKRVADEHGGHISATSEVGKGSMFRIELPI
jgi:signal transduction histidine kinase